MNHISKESIEQLISMFSKIYNFRYYNLRFRFINMTYQEFEESNELRMYVNVEVDSAEPRGEGVDYHEYWENYTPVKTTTHNLEFIIPLSDNQVVDVNGKSRVQINSARHEPLWKFYKNSFKVQSLGGLFVNIKDDVVSIYNPNEYGCLVTSLRWVCRDLGIFEKLFPLEDVKKIEVDSVTEAEHAEIMKILLSIPMNEKVKSKMLLVSAGEVKFNDSIDQYFLSTCINILQQGRSDEFNVHTPLDYSFMGAISGLVYDIDSSIDRLRKDIRYNYTKNGELYNRSVQNAISKHYNMQSEDIRDVQVKNDSNSLSVMSQGSTIYFYDREDKDSAWGKEQLQYDALKYFNGVIDPVRSRDSNLINTNNELTLGTEIVGDEIFITVVNISTNTQEKLKYEDFIANKILSEENFKNGEIIRNRNGKYTILQYAKYTVHDEFPEGIVYARSSESMLSYSTSMLPFANRMVSTRSLLSSHFLDQSIPVLGAKPTAVHTSMSKKLYEICPSNIKSKYDGVVVDVRDQYIKIKTADGKVHVEGRDKYTETTNHTTNEFHPTVKIGDTVTKGQVISASNSFVDGEFSTLVPLVVCYGTYLASEHEDGIILTESAAKKFGHPALIDVTYDFKDNYVYTFCQNTTDPKLDSWSMAKKGSIVKSGDVLFRLKRIKSKTYKNHLISVIGADENAFEIDTLYETFELKVPYNIRGEGEIESIRLYFNNNVDSIWYPRTNHDTPCLDWDRDPNVEPAHSYFESLAKTEDRELSKFLGYTVSNTYEFDSANVAMHFEVKIKHINTIGKGRLGGKLSNLYASKGVNVDVIPDDMAPYVKGVTDENGNPLRIECFISSLSTYSRTNPGQIDEVKLGLIAMQTWIKLIRDADPENLPPSTVEFLNLLYPHGWDFNQLYSDGSKYGYVRILVEPFDTYYTNKLILNLLDRLGLGNGDMPVTLPIFNNKETEYPCTIGITSLMRLHFIQEAKSSYTAENSRTLSEPSDVIGYQNGERVGGQKIGAQEIWASAAHGILDIIEDNASSNDNKRARLHSAAILLGLKLSD